MTTFGTTFGGPPFCLTPMTGIDPKACSSASRSGMLEVAGGGNDDVLGRVGAPEMVAQPLLRERLDALFGPKDRPAQRMALPERLGENLVDEIVGRVLDHLDLFEDDLLLAFDVDLVERGAKDDVRQDVDGKRQMLVEHLDVVAGVLFRRKRVELAADGVDRLGDVLRRARAVPLNSMCSTKCAMPLSSSVSCRDPRVSHTPRLTERTCPIDSVTRRIPLSSASRTIMKVMTNAVQPLGPVHDPWR